MAADMDKVRQRAMALAARQAFTEKERWEKSAVLCRRLLALPQTAEAGVFLSYMAVHGEADMTLLHETLWAAGKTLAFPVCGPDGQMEAWVPEGRQAVRPGRFGIPEPDPAASRALAPEEIELAVIPVVAFDSACMRLGRGAGYYDRFLLRCQNALRVAVAFEAQRLDRVAAEGHDLPMDWIITEEAVYPK